MKHGILISLLVILICISAGVFLLLNIDISSKFEDVLYNTQSPNSARARTYQPVQNDGANDNIAEDPEVGILYVPYDYTAPVPEGEPADLSYFERCVFIGDSRMLGLIRYTEVDPINYCSEGFSVIEYDNKKFVKIDEENFTVKEALRKNNEFDAIYIATGINELGWTKDKFSDKYRTMIADIKSVSGHRPIYIQLIMPVTTKFEKSKIMNPFKLKNSSVESFNEMLREIAVDYKVFFLDCAYMFALEDKTLDPAKSTDGAHLTRDAYKQQLDFYKTHVVITKNRVFI